MYKFRQNSEKAHMVPNVTTCHCHIKWYHVVYFISSANLVIFKLTGVGYLQYMVQEEQLQVETTKLPRRPRKRLNKQHWRRVDLTAIWKKFHTKNGSFPTVIPYFMKLLLSGWLQQIRDILFPIRAAEVRSWTSVWTLNLWTRPKVLVLSGSGSQVR